MREAVFGVLDRQARFALVCAQVGNLVGCTACAFIDGLRKERHLAGRFQIQRIDCTGGTDGAPEGSDVSVCVPTS